MITDKLDFNWLSTWFAEHGWTWKVGGKDIAPSSSDMSKTIDTAIKLLYTEPVGTQLSVGRLIVRKETSTHDIYVLVGSIDKDTK